MTAQLSRISDGYSINAQRTGRSVRPSNRFGAPWISISDTKRGKLPESDLQKVKIALVTAAGP
jgi:hypothetical protein